MIGGDRPVSSEIVRNVPTGPLRKGPTGIEPARIVAGQPGGAKGEVMLDGDTARIDARHIYYKTLNEQIREQIEAGAHTVILDSVNGQRYIGAGLKATAVTLRCTACPGNDLATFMDGPTVDGRRERPGRYRQHYEPRPCRRARRRRRRARLRHARRPAVH